MKQIWTYYKIRLGEARMNNNKSTIIDFTSKQCKDNLHGQCGGRWKGLGFEIICGCKCNHNKNNQALDRVEGPRANAQTERIIPGATQNDS
jgi:hypothetical protein